MLQMLLVDQLAKRILQRRRYALHTLLSFTFLLHYPVVLSHFRVLYYILFCRILLSQICILSIYAA